MIITYGTAGFRSNANNLDEIIYRMGMLSAVRSILYEGRPVGIMITASHNPVEDNGVKIIEPNGEILDQAWEIIATELVMLDKSQVTDYLEKILQKFNNKLDSNHSIIPKIILGQDNRPSGEKLLQRAVEGGKLYNANIQSFGLVTTPMLHFLVVQVDKYPLQKIECIDYTKYIHGVLKSLIQNPEGLLNGLVVDAANGVGIYPLNQLCDAVNIGLTVINKGEGILNYECGADYVKTMQKPPCGLQLEPGKRYASFDGDADRLIYYSLNNGKFVLLDGDHMAALFAKFFGDSLEKLGLKDKFKIGVVQTAYANGNSTKYIRDNIGVDTCLTCTGIKHLHAQALKYDIGIYFEANGHGTVLFKPSTIETLQNHSASGDLFKIKEQLLGIAKLINQTVGDAYTDLLAIECILYFSKMSIRDWISQYTDLPNKLTKHQVLDRFQFKTVDYDTRLEHPKEIQIQMDKILEKIPKSRAFIRPSGTEDVVRLYVEAETEDQVQIISNQISELIVKSSCQM